MTQVPVNARQPQDRKPKAAANAAGAAELAEAVFTFEHEGKSYRFTGPTAALLTPGFVRRNRKNEAEAMFSIMEELTDQPTLAVIDNMTWEQNAAFLQALSAHVQDVMQVSLGELSASSR